MTILPKIKASIRFAFLLSIILSTLNIELISQQESTLKVNSMYNSGTYTHFTLPNFSLIDEQAFNRQVFDSIVAFEYDTIEWRIIYKKLSKFDEDNNTITWFNYSTSNDEFELTSKSVVKTDGDGRLQSKERYEMRNHIWVGIDSEYHAFDDAGNKTKYESRIWDSKTGDWSINSFKRENEFDDNNNLLVSIGYSWNSEKSDWVQNSMQEYLYNDDGWMVKKNSYARNSNNNDGANLRKTLYEEHDYDLNGNITQTLRYKWNNDDNQFILDYKHEYRYEAPNNIFQTYYLPIDNGWKIGERRDYYGNKNLDSMKWYISQIIGGPNEFTDWNIMKGNFKYNEDNELIERSSLSHWNHSLQKWSLGSGRRLVFDSTFISNQYWHIDENLNDTIIRAKVNYYYSSQIPSWIDINMSVFPNPFKDYINLDIEYNFQIGHIELFDINGRLIRKFKISDDIRINTSNLRSGIYIYRFSSKNFSKVGKIIKQ